MAELDIAFHAWQAVVAFLLAVYSWHWVRDRNEAGESDDMCDVNRWQFQELKRGVRDSRGRFIKWGSKQ
jgi:hypothetical protein